MRPFLHASLMVAAVALSFAPAFAGEAAACSPPRDPTPMKLLPTGIHRVTPAVSGQIARDGGILLQAEVVGVDDAALLTGIVVAVKADGVPVAGSLRVLKRGSTTSDTNAVAVTLQFVVDGLLPVTSALDVTASYDTPADVENEPQHAWKMQVNDVLLTDLAVPVMKLEAGPVSKFVDAGSPLLKCELKTPQQVDSRGGCDGAAPGGSQTITSTTFRSRLAQNHTANLSVPGRYDHGVQQYIEQRSRVTWAGGSWDIGTYPMDGWGFVVPDGAEPTGEVCFEVTATSTLLPGFPKVTKTCLTLAPLTPISEAEQQAHFDKEAARCATVVSPTGAEVPLTTEQKQTAAANDSGGGCSTSARPGGARTGDLPAGLATGALGLVLARIARFARRRRDRAAR